MNTFLLIVAAACIAWGLGVALVVAIADDRHHPIAYLGALLARTAAYLRMTWSAR